MSKRRLYRGDRVSGLDENYKEAVCHTTTDLLPCRYISLAGNYDYVNALFKVCDWCIKI